MKRTPITRLIETYRASTGCSQKDLAARLHDYCAPAMTPEKGSLKYETFKTKLSKLMNDDLDGIEFFRKEPALGALSSVLEKEAQFLDHLLSIPRLIIHPRVSNDRRECVRQQAQNHFGTSDWVLTPTLPVDATHDETQALQAILEARGDEARPVMVLVEPHTIATEHHRAYATAQLTLGTLADRPRGVEIVEQPELLPLPPPSPPRLLDATGRVLHEVPKLAAAARDAFDATPDSRRPKTSWIYPVFGGPQASSAWGEFVAGLAPEDQRATLSERLRCSLNREEAPTFYPEEMLCWVRSKIPFLLTSPPRISQLFSAPTTVAWQLTAKDAPTELRAIQPMGRQKLPQQEHPEKPGATTATIAESLAAALENEDLDGSYVWQHRDAFFVVGTRAAALNALLREECPGLQLRRPLALAQLAARLRERRNPHRLPESPWFTELSQQSLDECGLRIDELPRIWHNEAALNEAERNFRYPHATVDAELSRGVREQLAELCQRRLVLTEEEAWLGLLLSAAVRADLLLLHADAALYGWTAVVNLGVHGFWRLRVTSHPKDDSRPLSVLYPDHFYQRGMGAPKDTHLDGGNVHLQLRRLPNGPAAA